MILKIKNFFKRFNLKKKKIENTLKESSFSRPRVDGIIKKEVVLNSNKTEFNKITIDKFEIKKADVSQGLKNEEILSSSVDESRRMFMKVAGATGLGLVAATLFPRGTDAYVSGSTPTSNVVGLKDGTNARINPATEETLSALSVGVKDDTNTRINPATEETLSSLVIGVKNDADDRINPATEDTLASLISGQNVEKLSATLSSSGSVHTPSSGKKIRVYASRFSLTADATSVSFRFTAGGTDHEKYVSPKTGGLYGANNHPNYIEGGADQVLYCEINGTTTVQINIDYLEV